MIARHTPVPLLEALLKWRERLVTPAVFPFNTFFFFFSCGYGFTITYCLVDKVTYVSGYVVNGFMVILNASASSPVIVYMCLFFTATVGKDNIGKYLGLLMYLKWLPLILSSRHAYPFRKKYLVHLVYTRR